MPCVSIIIPTYNRTALLYQALESVFAQTFRDYELIVVDDGSEEDIRSALIGTGRPNIYERIQHAGQSAARNQGLERAQGKQIAFLDSDDVWEPTLLAKLTTALDAAPDAGFAYCDYATFDERGIQHATYLPPAQKIHGSLFAALLQENFLCTGALLFRRECFARVGKFDLQLPPVEDWDLWLRIAHEYAAVYVDEPLVRIRQDAAHASRDPRIIYPLNLRIMEKLRHELSDARRYAPLLNTQTRYFHRALAHAYRVRGQPFQAIKHLAQSIRVRVL